MLQAKDDYNSIKLLQGKWAFEDAYTVETDEIVHFDPDNGFVKFYTELDIRFDTAILKVDNVIQKVKYEVEGNSMGAYFSSGKTFFAEWGILRDELYLEFTIDDINDTSEKMRIIVVYKRK